LSQPHTPEENAMIKLSDAQLVILSAACARENGSLLPTSGSLNGSAASMVLHSLINKGLAGEVPANRNMPIWREAEDGAPISLRATAAAYQTLGLGEMAGEEQEDQAVPKPSTRPNSKQAHLVEMLKRPEGASLIEIAETFGWQAHTVRGAIAGSLKKKLGLVITSEKIEGRGRVYKIAE
jgi:hypothetical protein